MLVDSMLFLQGTSSTSLPAVLGKRRVYVYDFLKIYTYLPISCALFIQIVALLAYTSKVLPELRRRCVSIRPYHNNIFTD